MYYICTLCYYVIVTIIVIAMVAAMVYVWNLIDLARPEARWHDMVSELTCSDDLTRPDLTWPDSTVDLTTPPDLTWPDPICAMFFPDGVH